jgi:hypothetical protein
MMVVLHSFEGINYFYGYLIEHQKMKYSKQNL